MRRKIIKQGAATLTLSLPARWAKRFNLKPGSDLDVEEQGQRLLVSTQQAGGPVKVEIDLSGISKLPKRVVEAKYIQGCEDLHIKVENREQARAIQNRIRALQGFEVVEQSKDMLRVKDIAGPQMVEIEPLVRRMFHMVSTMGKEAIVGLKAKDTQLEYIEEMEEGINRWWDLCSRSINSQGLQSYAQTTSTYLLLFLLEATADEFKKALHWIRQHAINISQDSIQVLEGVVKFLHQLEDLVFNFSLKRAESMASSFDLLSLSIDGKIHTKSPEEVVVVMHFKNMLEYLVWGMNQCLVMESEKRA